MGRGDIAQRWWIDQAVQPTDVLRVMRPPPPGRQAPEPQLALVVAGYTRDGPVRGLFGGGRGGAQRPGERSHARGDHQREEREADHAGARPQEWVVAEPPGGRESRGWLGLLGGLGRAGHGPHDIGGWPRPSVPNKTLTWLVGGLTLTDS